MKKNGNAGDQIESDTERKEKLTSESWGYRLRSVMHQNNITAEEIARRSGVNAENIYKYAQGSIKQPRGDKLAKIASAIGVSRLWLQEGIGSPYPNRLLTGYITDKKFHVFPDDVSASSESSSIILSIEPPPFIAVEVRDHSLFPKYRLHDLLIFCLVYDDDYPFYLGKDRLTAQRGGIWFDGSSDSEASTEEVRPASSHRSSLDAREGELWVASLRWIYRP